MLPAITSHCWDPRTGEHRAAIDTGTPLHSGIAISNDSRELMVH